MVTLEFGSAIPDMPLALFLSTIGASTTVSAVCLVSSLILPALSVTVKRPSSSLNNGLESICQLPFASTSTTATTSLCELMMVTLEFGSAVPDMPLALFLSTIGASATVSAILSVTLLVLPATSVAVK